MTSSEANGFIIAVERYYSGVCNRYMFTVYFSAPSGDVMSVCGDTARVAVRHAVSWLRDYRPARKGDGS